MCIYKIHSLKRTDAGGNGLWDGARNWDPWKILRLTMTGRKVFETLEVFFLEPNVKIYLYIGLFGWISEEHISKQSLLHHG